MDIDLIHKVTEEYKTRIEKISRKKLEPVEDLILKKIFADYSEKVLLKDFDNITKKYCEIDEYFNPYPNPKDPYFKEDKLGYTTLYDETRISLSKLITIYIKKDTLYTNNNTGLGGLLDVWMYWASMDDYQIKSKLEQKYDQKISKIGVINPKGWKTIKEWYDYKKKVLT